MADNVLRRGLVQPFIWDQTYQIWVLIVDTFEIFGHQLTLFTRCLVMLKTINMGERQESVVGILSRKYIIQCLFSRQIIY
jgi:hypothetical protein